MRGVYAEGISTMQTEMDDMQKWDMKSFAISDYNAISVGEDTMMSTYKVTLEGTYDGKDASGTYNAGSVWKKHEGGMAGHFPYEREGGDFSQAGGLVLLRPEPDTAARSLAPYFRTTSTPRASEGQGATNTPLTRPAWSKL